MGPVGPDPGQSSRGPRTTNLLGVINKTVQIPMVGLNIESTVSFPQYIPNRGGGDRGSNTGNRVMDSLFFTKMTMLVKKHVYPIQRAAQIRYLTRLTRGSRSVADPKGAGDMPPYSKQFFAMCSFKLKIYQNLFSAGASPRTRWGSL